MASLCTSVVWLLLTEVQTKTELFNIITLERKLKLHSVRVKTKMEAKMQLDKLGYARQTYSSMTMIFS